ncbi:MAG TPA: universal stress protein [Thermodesulfobacteriota bacterium]|nr:universal stress protein [Thermodesulfobacteriota bacterium]
MYNTILVPLDGSKLAECVLPHVETLVKGSQAKRVIFARVVEPFLPPTSEYIFSDDQIKKVDKENRAFAEKYLKEIVGQAKYGSGVRIETTILSGNVPDSLAEFANKNGADIIVIATHGRSGVSRWVWGGVADRILRSSCVPVLMVRAPGCVPGI